MSEVQNSSGFLDTSLARLLSLVLAVLIAALMWMNWSADFRALFAGETMSAPAIESQTPAKPANPALQACLDQRVGDVDNMKSEGIISDSQYDAFRSRAEDLCRAQNPG